MVSNESRIVFWIFLTIIESLQIFWSYSWVTSKWESPEGRYWFLSRCWMCLGKHHYNNVMMGAMASQITSLTTVYSTVYSNRRSKKIEARRQWPLWGEFTSGRWILHTEASNAENVSIWWRHHDEIVFSFSICGNPLWWKTGTNQSCSINAMTTADVSAPVTQSFDGFFDMYLNKRLSKQSTRRWLETPSRSLWRHCNDIDSCDFPFFSTKLSLNPAGQMCLSMLYHQSYWHC